MNTNFLSLLLSLIIIFGLSSCIDTPEKAMSQYEYEGMENCAQTMTEYYDFAPIMEKVFEDSIVPMILRDYPFEKIVKTADIVKGHKSYDLIVNANIDRNRILHAFTTLKPTEAAKLYIESCNRFKGVEETFSDSIIDLLINKASIPEIVAIHNLLLKTPRKNKVKAISLPEQKYLSYFKFLDVYKLSDFYSSSNKLFTNLDSVFMKYALPVIINTPYPVFKELSEKYKSTVCYPIIKKNLPLARAEFAQALKEDIDICKSSAIEAFDLAVSTGIELELDSLAECDAKEIANKMSGIFQGSFSSLFSSDDSKSKFKKQWDEYVRGEKYDEIFDRHIQMFLSEVYTNQRDKYVDFLGKERKRIVYPFMSEPIVLDFPSSIIADIKKHSKDKRLAALKGIAEWVPYLGDAIMLYDLTKSGDKQEELDDDATFNMLCQSLILTQIGDDYREDVRNNVISIINKSYDRLYNDILKAI